MSRCAACSCVGSWESRDTCFPVVVTIWHVKNCNSLVWNLGSVTTACSHNWLSTWRLEFWPNNILHVCCLPKYMIIEVHPSSPMSLSFASESFDSSCLLAAAAASQQERVHYVLPSIDVYYSRPSLPIQLPTLILDLVFASLHSSYVVCGSIVHHLNGLPRMYSTLGLT